MTGNLQHNALIIVLYHCQVQLIISRQIHNIEAEYARVWRGRFAICTILTTKTAVGRWDCLKFSKGSKTRKTMERSRTHQPTQTTDPTQAKTPGNEPPPTEIAISNDNVCVLHKILHIYCTYYVYYRVKTWRGERTILWWDLCACSQLLLFVHAASVYAAYVNIRKR